MTLCIWMRWGWKRGNNTENKLRITINNRSSFKSSVTLLDFYFSRTSVFWAINIQVIPTNIINLRKPIAKVTWKINLKFHLDQFSIFFYIHLSSVPAMNCIKAKEKLLQNLQHIWVLCPRSSDYTVQKGNCVLHYVELGLYFSEEIMRKRKEQM